MLDNQISKNVYREECACHCNCGKASIDYQLLLVTQKTCDLVSESLGYKCIADINRVFSCEAHNKEVGGLDDSYHLEGAAIDWSIREISLDQLIGYIGVAIRELGFEDMFDLVKHIDYIHMEIDLRRILEG